jgi:phosphoribosylglycinamide formyltransferase-1
MNDAVIKKFLARMPGLGNSRRDQQRLAKLLQFSESLPGITLAPAGERHLSLSVARKTLAYYMNNHHNDGRICICCKSTPARQQARVAADGQRYYVPAYLGVKGWVSLRLDLKTVEWDDVFSLLLEAYRAQAPRRLAAEME